MDRRFQYNSCYCLSEDMKKGKTTVFNFNTTLVIVYRNILMTSSKIGANFNTTLVIVYLATLHKLRADLNYFNTTLVIVYRNLMSFVFSTFSISIQLLLLFIQSRKIDACTIQKFQYNSCYCLSNNEILFTHRWTRFQYNSCYCLSTIPDRRACKIS